MYDPSHNDDIRFGFHPLLNKIVCTREVTSSLTSSQLRLYSLNPEPQSIKHRFR